MPRRPTSRALYVARVRLICVRSNQTHGYLRKSSHCVRDTFVPRTSGPLLDAEIKMSLISALFVRHPSVFLFCCCCFFLTQQTHVPSVRVRYTYKRIHLTCKYDVRVAYAPRTFDTFFVLLPSFDASLIRYTDVLFTSDMRHSRVTRASNVRGTYAV
jgi:hypothetical protein